MIEGSSKNHIRGRQEVGNRITRTIIGVAIVVLLAACGDSGGKPSATVTVGPRPSLTPIAWRSATMPILATNAEQIAPIGSLLSHTVTVNRIVFSHDSRVVISQDGNGKAIVWDLTTGKKRMLIASPAALLAAYFSADDSRIISVGFDNQIRTFDATNGTQTNIFGTDNTGVTVTDASADGQVLAVGSNDGVIGIWRSVPPLQPTVNIQAAAGRLIRALTVSPDGKLVASIASDDVVRVWDAQTGAAKASFNKFNGSPLKATFSPDGSLLAVAAGIELRVFNISTSSEKFKVTQPDLGAQSGMAFSPDGRLIAAGSSGDVVYVWETASTQLVGKLAGHDGHLTRLAWSPDGGLLFSCGLSTKAGAYVWDARSFKVGANTFPRGSLGNPGDSIYTGAWSPDGQRLIVADSRGSLIVWGIPAHS